MVLKVLFPGDSGNLNTPAFLAGYEADTVYVAYSTTDSSYLIYTYRNNDLIDLRDMSDDSDAVVFAGADNDTVLGSAGIDQYFDQSGNDLAVLGDGEDSVRAGVGNDTLDGGDGRDWLSFGLIYRDMVSGYDTAPTGVVFDMAKTTRQDLGFWGKDVIRNFEQVTGTALDDKIYGDAKDNYIDGDNGSDLLLGRAGNDTLKGWNGADTMVGGRGIDTFVLEDRPQPY
jgi:serralysin